MQFIQDFINSFSEKITAVFDFFENLIDNTVLLFEYIGVASNNAYALVDSLPDWLQAFGLITVLVSVLFTILGRSTGGAKND